MFIPVILCGGTGARLWPISRDSHPKPFMELPDGQTLLEKTLRRAASLTGVREIVTVSSAQDSFKVTNECQRAGLGSLALTHLLEPVGRNTAAAIACAALQTQALHAGEDVCLLVLAADHLILDQAAFQAAVSDAHQLAVVGQIVTFGIHPDRPETGYGYIESVGNRVTRFVEKPDLNTAQAYLTSGNFLWNAGMFCFKASVMLAEMKQHCPDIVAAAQHCLAASRTKGTTMEREVALDVTTFMSIRDNSIDFEVMEKTPLASVVPCDIGWSDIGSWKAVSALVEADENGNRTDGNALLRDTTNCYINSSGRMVATLGVSDLMIVDTDDALLVAHVDASQDVKHLYASLKAAGNELYKNHRTTHRPWGAYTVIEERQGFKVKRIDVNPGASLSLQMHRKRSEHWIVVQGVAEVVNGDAKLSLISNQSTYIPAGTKHRLSNLGSEPLILIEVQFGSYLGEDDIVRFEDIYGRV